MVGIEGAPGDWAIENAQSRTVARAAAPQQGFRRPGRKNVVRTRNADRILAWVMLLAGGPRRSAPVRRAAGQTSHRIGAGPLRQPIDE